MKVNKNKLMKYPSQAFKYLGVIDLFDDRDTDACIEKVMMINEEANFKELPLEKSIVELKSLLSTLKYAFLDTQHANPVIISS